MQQLSWKIAPSFQLAITGLVLQCLLKLKFPSFVDKPMSWFEADNHCRSLGAKLVEINSEEENVVIVKEINKGGYKNRSMWFWIGLTDKGEEGTWKLASSGAEADYLNWDKSYGTDPEPNNVGGNEDCAHIRSGGCPDWDHSAWADLDCSKTMVKITCIFDPNVQFSMNALCEFKTETETGENLVKGKFIIKKIYFLQMGGENIIRRFWPCQEALHWGSFFSLLAALHFVSVSGKIQESLLRM